MYIVGILIVAALVAAFAATVSLAILRYRPATATSRRRVIAALAGGAITLSPALVSSAQAGLPSFLAVAVVGVPLVAALFGYPAVRLFEPRRPPEA